MVEDAFEVFETLVAFQGAERICHLLHIGCRQAHLWREGVFSMASQNTPGAVMLSRPVESLSRAPSPEETGGSLGWNSLQFLAGAGE